MVDTQKMEELMGMQRKTEYLKEKMAEDVTKQLNVLLFKLANMEIPIHNDATVLGEQIATHFSCCNGEIFVEFEDLSSNE